MAALVRVALDVVVGKESLFFDLVVAPRQAKDNAMDMGLAACVAHPFECAVRERDFQPVPLEEQGPELRHLLALRYRIRGDKTNAGRFPTAPLATSNILAC